MGTYKFMMGTYKFMMGTYKFMMGTYKMQVMHKFVLVNDNLDQDHFNTNQQNNISDETNKILIFAFSTKNCNKKVC
jgi:hypothetical protein